jgi:hypothetical protein
LILYHFITPRFSSKTKKENVPKKGECREGTDEAEGARTYKQNIEHTRRMTLESTEPTLDGIRVSFALTIFLVIFAAVSIVKCAQEALAVFKRAVRLVRWATRQTDKGEEERKQIKKLKKEAKKKLDQWNNEATKKLKEWKQEAKKQLEERHQTAKELLEERSQTEKKQLEEWQRAAQNQLGEWRQTAQKQLKEQNQAAKRNLEEREQAAEDCPPTEDSRMQLMSCG